MKVQFCSDLHLEMRPKDYKLAQTNADIIILAGDVHVGIDAVEFAVDESQRQKKPVIFVAGNHEYYGQDYDHLLNKMRLALIDNPQVHFLENDELIIDGTRFLGATLWTDYKGDTISETEDNMNYSGRCLRDHVVIRRTYKNFTPQDAAAINSSSVAFLSHKLNEEFDGRTFVITHHGPSPQCQHQHYPVGQISTAFHSNFDSLVRKADAWIFGHTHSNLNTKVGNCRLVSNQMGYPGENMLVPFRDDWVMDI